MKIDKLINKLSEKFRISEGKTKLKKKRSIYDFTNVMAVEAKTEIGKSILSFFKEKGIPKDHHIKYETKTFGIGLYSLSFVKWAVEFLNFDEGCDGTKEALQMSLREDYPLTLESKNFKVIIAPRVRIEEEKSDV